MPVGLEFDEHTAGAVTPAAYAGELGEHGRLAALERGHGLVEKGDGGTV